MICTRSIVTSNSQAEWLGGRTFPFGFPLSFSVINCLSCFKSHKSPNEIAVFELPERFSFRILETQNNHRSKCSHRTILKLGLWHYSVLEMWTNVPISKYLGGGLDNKLERSANIEAVYRRGQRRLRSFNVCSDMMDKRVKRAGSVVGRRLDPLSAVVEQQMRRKIYSILENKLIINPLHSILAGQRSNCTERLQDWEVQEVLCPHSHKAF